MRLKFIGKSNSMGLIHDKVYYVEIKTKRDYIWVIIPGFRHGVFGVWKCPYSSPQSFAENWSKP